MFSDFDLISKVYNIDTDFAISDNFIDSIVGDYKKPYLRPKYNNKQSKSKNKNIKSYEMKPRLINYYSKGHIYKHIENTLHEDGYLQNTLRELVIKIKTMRKVILMDNIKYSLYLMASDKDHFNIYNGSEHPLLPLPRRTSVFGRQHGITFKTLSSYNIYLHMARIRVILEKKYLMFLDGKILNI